MSLTLQTHKVNKPIEYFYGENYGRKDIQEIKDKLNELQEDKASPELVKKFFDDFIPYTVIINNITDQINDIRDNLIEEVKIQGLDLQEYIDQLNAGKKLWKLHSQTYLTM